MLLYIIAGLIVLDCLGHSLTGEKGTLQPLLAEDSTGRLLANEAKGRLIRVSWHQAPLAWLAIAVSLVLSSPSAAVLYVFAALFAANLATNTWAMRRFSPPTALVALITGLLVYAATGA